MEPLSDTAIAALVGAVQHNCAISDARHARDYSLCIYLLRMREYFRWKHALPVLQKLDVEQVGNWVSERELWWDKIEHQEYQPLSIAGTEFDPFDHQSINLQLLQQGLVYSAGIGRMGQPHFALSRLLAHRIDNHIEYFDCGQELARDTITVPAMTRDQMIFIRRDGIRRLLWELYDDWCLHRKPGPLAAVVEHFGLQNDASLEAALCAASEDIAPLFEAHERGEVAAGQVLGKDYSELTLSMAGTRGEHYLRALRDLLADSLSTWSMIVERRSVHYLDFWLAGLNGLRLELLVRSGVHDTLTEGRAEDRLCTLQQLAERQPQRWTHLCKGLLSAYRARPEAELRKLDVEATLAQLWQSAA